MRIASVKLEPSSTSTERLPPRSLMMLAGTRFEPDVAEAAIGMIRSRSEANRWRSAKPRVRA